MLTEPANFDVDPPNSEPERIRRLSRRLGWIDLSPSPFIQQIRAQCGLICEIPSKISEPLDSLAERSEFELPVPVSKLSDDSVVL
jgi:hypothetical protein